MKAKNGSRTVCLSLLESTEVKIVSANGTLFAGSKVTSPVFLSTLPASKQIFIDFL